MYKNYNQQALDNDIPAETLIGYLEAKETELGLKDAYIYHNFPLYVGLDDVTLPTHVLVISNKYGVIVFKCINDSDILSNDFSSEIEELGQSHSLILSKLIKNKALRQGLGQIKFPLNLAIFVNLPIEHEESGRLDIRDEYKIVCGRKKISKLFANFKSVDLGQEVIGEIRSCLEGSGGIVKIRKKNLDVKKEKGKILDEIERRIALFDEDQRKSSFYVPNRPQRIRGLAGSGKTIVLAMKAAQIHINEPNAQILYTFYTKSLYDFIKRLITRFYRQFSEKDPNWDNIHILHAWGGRNLPGVYSSICENNQLTPQTLGEVMHLKDKFNIICGRLLNLRLQKKFDYAILDEAQDFPINFYRLCRKVTIDDKIFWALDEFQNVIDVEIQNVKQTFGPGENGQFIELDGNDDIVLHKCYRNDRKILLCAFALGLGIYSDKIIQMPEDNNHWEDLGFKVIQGASKEGDEMVIERPKETSPIHLEKDDSVKYESFKTIAEECKYVAECIKNEIEKGIPPEDVLIISLDDKNTKEYFSVLTALLRPGIKTFNLSEAPFNNTAFRQEGLITLSTVYRAKGNEAGSVYIVGADSVFMNKDFISERNKIFTAITRAKIWVTITGMGEDMCTCIKEIKEALRNYPKLKFVMPNRARLKTIQRDLGFRQELISKYEKIKEQARQLGMDLDKPTRSKKKKIRN